MSLGSLDKANTRCLSRTRTLLRQYFLILFLLLSKTINLWQKYRSRLRSHLWVPFGRPLATTSHVSFLMLIQAKLPRTNGISQGPWLRRRAAIGRYSSCHSTLTGQLFTTVDVYTDIWYLGPPASASVLNQRQQSNFMVELFLSAACTHNIRDCVFTLLIFLWNQSVSLFYTALVQLLTWEFLVSVGSSHHQGLSVAKLNCLTPTYHEVL